MLMSFSKFPPSLSAPTLPSALSEELSAAALVPMGALLLQLLAVRPFAEFVLQNDLRESNARRYRGWMLFCFSLCSGHIVLYTFQ